MIRSISYAVAVGLALGGCMAPSQPMATLAVTTATTTDAFVPMAVSSNLLEIESSRLALSRSRDSHVRQLANEMIRDHRRASQRMASVARASGIATPPAVLSTRHQTMLDQLASTPNREFDAAYLALQSQAHDEAVTLFRTYGTNGENPRLAAFARQTLPTLQRHAAHVERASRS
ncbi:putative membrane protein [Bosea sp. OAE506]|uniref:DUF4142 domain-containing protein n=1 Tax=Bosea sp. OAE506 TaxID=2663870 RepID=UPI00178AAE67